MDSYIALCTVLGDKFAPTVARGRVDCFHPDQLLELIRAGFIPLESAQLRIKPTVIPDDVSLILQEARPERSLEAIEMLNWDAPVYYYMFSRRIDRWNDFIKT